MSIDTQQPQQECRYGVAARFYDLAYGPLAPHDVPFYLALAQEHGGPVLELGCGTGRVGIELARAGFDVLGLDLSGTMLAAYRAKLEREPADVQRRVELVEASMADFELGRRFGLILAPFRAFQHLLTPTAQRGCLNYVRAHLADGGRYVHDAFNPSVPYIADALRLGKTWRGDVEVADPETGGLLRREFYANPDAGAQIHDLAFRYERFDADGRLEQVWVERLPMRWQWRWEAQYLLELCGLELEAAYGDYVGTPLGDNSRNLVLVCRGR